MKKLNDAALAALEDRHIDDLAALAFQYEETVEVEEILSEYDNLPADADGDPAQAQRILAAAGEKLAREQAEEKRRTRRQRMRSFGLRFIEVAACVLLLLALAAPLAIANLDLIRTRFAELFTLESTDNTGHLEYRETVPGGFEHLRWSQWGGLYFPAHMPEGFTQGVTHQDGHDHYIRYDREDGGAYLVFAELMNEPGAIRAATAWHEVNGSGAAVCTCADGTLSVTWYNGVRWFRVNGAGLTQEQLLEVARSVTPLKGQASLDALLAAAGRGMSVPQEYAGLFYPAWLPPGLTCVATDAFYGTVTADLSDGNGREVTFIEVYGDTGYIDMIGGGRVPVSIGDREGLLRRSGDGRVITLDWINDYRLFTLNATGLSEEEVIAIAESVTLIDQRTAVWGAPLPSPAPAPTPLPAFSADAWANPYVPTWIPPDCATIIYTNGSVIPELGSLAWSDARDSLIMDLTIAPDEIGHRGTSDFMLSMPVDVNGTAGILRFSPMDAYNYDLDWQLGEYWFCINGDDMDEVLRMARSIRPGTAADIPRSSDACPQAPEGLAPYQPALLPEADGFTVAGACSWGSGFRTDYANQEAGLYFSLCQFDNTVTLLHAGFATQEHTEAQAAIGSRTAHVYTVNDPAFPQIALIWHEADCWYLLWSYSMSHEALYGIVGSMQMVDANHIPATVTPAPAATPAPTAAPVSGWPFPHRLAFLPEGFTLTGVTGSCAVWAHADGNVITLTAHGALSDSELAALTTGAIPTRLRADTVYELSETDLTTLMNVSTWLVPIDGVWYGVSATAPVNILLRDLCLGLEKIPE